MSKPMKKLFINILRKSPHHHSLDPPNIADDYLSTFSTFLGE